MSGGPESTPPHPLGAAKGSPAFALCYPGQHRTLCLGHPFPPREHTKWEIPPLRVLIFSTNPSCRGSALQRVHGIRPPSVPGRTPVAAARGPRVPAAPAGHRLQPEHNLGSGRGLGTGGVAPQDDAATCPSPGPGIRGRGHRERGRDGLFPAVPSGPAPSCTAPAAVRHVSRECPRPRPEPAPTQRPGPAAPGPPRPPSPSPARSGRPRRAGYGAPRSAARPVTRARRT